MPIALGTAALIGAGINAGVAGGNAYAQGRMNKKTREYNTQMYERQRKDALADWATVNDYNSPTAQMARFRDAGLNENLIYGQNNESQAVRSSDTGSWNPRAPQVDFDATSQLGSYYNARVQEAQTDNLRAQNTVAVNQAALLAAQTANVGQNTAKSKFDLELASDLRATSLETAKAALRKLDTETGISIRQDERNAAITSSNLSEAAERILKLRLEQSNTRTEGDRLRTAIQGLQKDNTLKDLDIQLRKQGVQPNDSLFMRVLARYLDGLIKSGTDKIKSLKPENFLKGLERFGNP